MGLLHTSLSNDMVPSDFVECEMFDSEILFQLINSKLADNPALSRILR